MSLCPRQFADIHKIKCNTQAHTEPYLYMFCSSLQLLQNLHREVEGKISKPNQTNQPNTQKKKKNTTTKNNLKLNLTSQVTLE